MDRKLIAIPNHPLSIIKQRIKSSLTQRYKVHPKRNRASKISTPSYLLSTTLKSSTSRRTTSPGEKAILTTSPKIHCWGLIRVLISWTCSNRAWKTSLSSVFPLLSRRRLPQRRNRSISLPNLPPDGSYWHAGQQRLSHSRADSRRPQTNSVEIIRRSLRKMWKTLGRRVLPLHAPIFLVVDLLWQQMGVDVGLWSHPRCSSLAQRPIKLERLGCRSRSRKIRNETVQDPGCEAILVARLSVFEPVYRGTNYWVCRVQQVSSLL